MKMFVLMVLFSTPAEPTPHELHGFAPRRAETMEQCLQHRSNLERYIEANKSPSVKFKAFCVEFRALGYESALEAFKATIGDPA